MVYNFIRKSRDNWLASPACPVTKLLQYIQDRGMMRDAQIDAIKTFLFLKLACNNRSLRDLFREGAFNQMNLDDEELTSSSREHMRAHPAAATLYECASYPGETGTALSPKLRQKLKSAAQEVDAEGFFDKLFYGLSYTDYLFSLPMGAGKTYLMAAFIYLELYFAENEPDNPAFAHNFIILAPSGLKASVIPSLKTIQNFDPSWVIPEPAASRLRRCLIFEVLDQNKSEQRSNRAKNPNVQKIANHQPLDRLFGFVAVTNAEKVILDRLNIDERGDIPLLIERTEDEKDRQANELRHWLGKLPHLSVFIDEVHHAATDEIKLRAVVSSWVKNNSFNSVIGFSGTPYLPKAEKIIAAPGLSVSLKEISTIVSYYPLADAIGNFLKTPIVRITSGIPRLQIIEQGIREFLDTYKDTIYSDGTSAKLGIYCSTISTLEEEVYPLATRLAEEYGLSPASAILKYHGGNKEYNCPADSRLQFSSLDQPFSTIRIILLAQIGREGWDCRSLTGIILSQTGDCPQNMVLQTACRCLRQVQKHSQESALIVLNESNAEVLEAQLRRMHHLSIDEFQQRAAKPQVDIHRYNRCERLKLPPLTFYQLKIQYNSLVIDKQRDTQTEIASALTAETQRQHTIRSARLGRSLNITHIEENHQQAETRPADFHGWLGMIAKESFGFLSLATLRRHEGSLRELFLAITREQDGHRVFLPQYRLELINANIRKAFYEKRTLQRHEELLPTETRLLKVENLTSPVSTSTPESFYPAQREVHDILRADEGPGEQQLQAIRALEAIGETAHAESLRRRYMGDSWKDRSFHYLPYRTDSRFEQTFLHEVLRFDQLEKLGLELYYNGDSALTEFRIRCYEWRPSGWAYIGIYTPDFLIVRRHQGAIHQALIVETKGQLYANDPQFRQKRRFVEGAFLEKNNEQFGYPRFDYLYLEDTIPAADRLAATMRAINKFFKK